MEFSIKDFLIKCDQIRSFARIWSHLLKKCLIKTSFFFAVFVAKAYGNSHLLTGNLTA